MKMCIDLTMSSQLEDSIESQLLALAHFSVRLDFTGEYLELARQLIEM